MGFWTARRLDSRLGSKEADGRWGRSANVGMEMKATLAKERSNSALGLLIIWSGAGRSCWGG